LHPAVGVQFSAGQTFRQPHFSYAVSPAFRFASQLCSVQVFYDFLSNLELFLSQLGSLPSLTYRELLAMFLFSDW
jgi:hypothetical protein